MVYCFDSRAGSSEGFITSHTIRAFCGRRPLQLTTNWISRISHKRLDCLISLTHANSIRLCKPHYASVNVWVATNTVSTSPQPTLIIILSRERWH